MPSGLLLQDAQGRVVFDGTQRIPKVLIEITVNAGELSKTGTLPRPIKGTLYYYYRPLSTIESEPYYDPMSYNYSVTVSGTQVTVTFIKYASWVTAPKAFTVYIGEY